MRYYSTTAGEMILQTGVSAGDTTLIVDTVAGLPVTFPFTLLVDYGTTSEEVVDVTAASGATLTVTRGRDSTIAQSHGFGAKIRHGVTARDYRDSREHEAATAAHGIAGAVVGTTDTQTLDNKTFLASADHAPLTVRQRAGNTAPMLDVRDAANARLAAFTDTGFATYSGANALLSVLAGGSALLFKNVASVRVSDDIHGLVGIVVSGATGKFLRLMSGASEVFSVAANGDVSGRAGTFASNVGVTGNVTATGNVSATGTVTGSNITTLTATSGTHTTDIAAVSTRVTAVETNLGSQTTFAATSAAKDGKRIHWVKVTITPNATGYATVSHGAGFTPSVIQGTAEFAYSVGVDTITATQCQIRLLNPTADIAVTTATDVMLFCCE